MQLAWAAVSVEPHHRRPPLPDHANKVPRVPLCELEKGPRQVDQLHARAQSLGGLRGWMSSCLGDPHKCP